MISVSLYIIFHRIIKILKREKIKLILITAGMIRRCIGNNCALVDMESASSTSIINVTEHIKQSLVA